MDDVKYDYYKDISSKAATATSSHKSITKGTHRSRKEIKEMTGEVKTYNLNKRLTWGEFKSWPDRHKMAYLQNIYNKFDPTIIDIARLFNVSKCTITVFFHDNVGMKSSKWFRGCNHKSISGMPSWEAFLAGEEVKENQPEELESEKVEDNQSEELKAKIAIFDSKEPEKVEERESVVKIDPEVEVHKEVDLAPGFDFMRFGITGTVDQLYEIMKCMRFDGKYHFTIIATKGAYGEEV